MIANIAFYVCSIILLASAALVVSSRNPVHSVLFLILSFFNAAVLFLIAGAEFLALILVIVYVGAVAVLFLFVVMMLDIDFAELRSGFQRYLPVGATVGAVLFVELLFVLGGWQFAPQAPVLRFSPVPANVSNTAALGRLLYTDYIFLFQAAGVLRSSFYYLGSKTIKEFHAKARFVKITQDGVATGNFWSIHELGVYGTAAEVKAP